MLRRPEPQFGIPLSRPSSTQGKDPIGTCLQPNLRGIVPAANLVFGPPPGLTSEGGCARKCARRAKDM